MVDDTKCGGDCCTIAGPEGIGYSARHGYLYHKNELIVRREHLSTVEEQLGAIGCEIVECCCVDICGTEVCVIEVGCPDEVSVPELRSRIAGAHPHYVLAYTPPQPAAPAPGLRCPPGLPPHNHASWFPDSQPIPWRPLPGPPAVSQSDVEVGILDAGWFFDPSVRHQPGDPNYGVWKWFGGRLEVPASDVEEQGPQLNASSGHGVFAASIVLQVAPAARVVGRKVPTKNGLTTDLCLAMALCENLDRFLQVDVLNLSWGAYTHAGEVLPLTGLVLQHMAERWYHDHGAPPVPMAKPVVVASTGNNGSPQPVYPAALGSVVGVGALDAGGTPAPACWSNFGPWVYSFAPGTNVVGAYLDGDFEFPDPCDVREPGPPPGCQPPGGLPQKSATFGGAAAWSGTSFAAPFVAGKLAADPQLGSHRAAAVARVRGIVT